MLPSLPTLVSAALSTALTAALVTGLPPAATAASGGGSDARSGDPSATGRTAADRPAARASAPRRIGYRQWDTAAELKAGTPAGTRVVKGRLGLVPDPTARRQYDGRRYEVGRWTSPWVAPGFGLTELVASWEATTPRDSWIEVEVRGRDAAGTLSSFDVLGRWTSGDRYTERQTVAGQADDLADVNVDTWRSAAAAGLTSWQLRVSLMRRPGTVATPTVDTLGAVASRLPAGDVATSKPGIASGTTLPVPRASQMVHDGHYPQWGGGGEAWCSPTSTSMVLAYYDALPPPADYAYVPAGHVDPWVDHAARMTYDSDYDGTGNWPFNTAYAASRTGHALVTRLRSLRDVERFIAVGIPVVLSIAFDRGGLDGAPISATDGHLLVVVGFTDAGDVVVNDPAAATRAGVRRTYDRGQVEDAWLPTTGGTVYVINDDAHPLPESPRRTW